MTLIPKNDRVPVQKLGDPLLVGETYPNAGSQYKVLKVEGYSDINLAIKIVALDIIDYSLEVDKKLKTYEKRHEIQRYETEKEKREKR